MTKMPLLRVLDDPFRVVSRLSAYLSSAVVCRPTTAALSIESHSQLYVKMRIILIKFIWHLRCFYHLAPDLQASSLY